MHTTEQEIEPFIFTTLDHHTINPVNRPLRPSICAFHAMQEGLIDWFISILFVPTKFNQRPIIPQKKRPHLKSNSNQFNFKQERLCRSYFLILFCLSVV